MDTKGVSLMTKRAEKTTEATRRTVITLRVDQINQLKALAMDDGLPMTRQIRRAVDEWLARQTEIPRGSKRA